jgi:hypothetical protein
MDVIFEDEDKFIAVWGTFDNGQEKCLGIRWESYPAVPVVVQKFLVQPTLEKMLAYASLNGRTTQVQKIQTALKELATYNRRWNDIWVE